MICASITRLDDKVGELETKERLSPVDQLAAKRLQQRLKDLNEGFKCLHFAIIDLLEQQEDLEMEQAAFDDHEHRVGSLGIACNWFCRTSLCERNQEIHNRRVHTGA